MSLSGFDSKWQDFPDYILGITEEIWEDRNLDSLHRYYSKDIIVRSPEGISQGNAQVIDATMATLAQFPDRTLLGEDVIYSGTPDAGLLSSHRITSTATHTGSGCYGVGSGKKLRYRVLADCHAINNQINDEWLVRDQGDIARQLGFSSKDYAQKLLNDAGDKAVFPFTPAQDIVGPYEGKGNDNAYGQRYKAILENLMHAQFSVVKKEYDRACLTEYAGGRSGISYASVDQFWLPLRSSFPNATFKVEHCIGREDPLMPPRAAIRWSLSGEHSGYGAFGKPTGVKVYVMGICHAEFGPWGVRREFALFDEVAIWKQILLQLG